MRQLILDNYTVDLFVDYAYSPDDSVHKYNHAYFFAEDGYCGSIFGISVHQDDVLLQSAVIGASGGGTGIHPTSLVYDEERLVICCSDSVFCLSLPALDLRWQTKADLVTCFQIFKYKNDYIVHGELEITRLDGDGKIIWQRSGGDIFVTLNSSQKDFLIAEDYILATDWQSRTYKFDFDGNEIEH